MEANPISTNLQDRIEAWVNEGGAVDDLNRGEALPMFKAELTC
jgi:hypothetical protein